ncbi:MAG: hypothetical protein WAT92_00195 [Saprospiraceae bacterium]
MARPIEWNDNEKKKAIEIIFIQMSHGNSVRQILKDNQELLPSRKLFYEWIAKDKTLSDHYAKVMELRADDIFDEILEIADDTTHDSIFTETGEKVNSEWISRSRLRVDARKWILSKMNPKKYGDKTDITTNGKEITGKYSDWTPEQIRAEIERLDNK